MLGYCLKSGLFLLFAVLCIQQVHAYCIYNDFTDGTVIHIQEINTYVPLPRVFNKFINAGSNECCPHTSEDCCQRKIEYDKSDFKVYFRWPKYNSGGHLVSCTSGGAIAFYGDETNFWAECSDAYGAVRKIPIIASDQG